MKRIPKGTPRGLAVVPFESSSRALQLLWAGAEELDRLRDAAETGREAARAAARERKAENDAELLAAVAEERERRPGDGSPSIAARLVDRFPPRHGIDDADPDGRARAIDALRKRIDRLTKR